MIEAKDSGRFATCATVTACSLNEMPPPETFSQRPPWGSVTFEGDNCAPIFHAPRPLKTVFDTRGAGVRDQLFELGGQLFEFEKLGGHLFKFEKRR